MITRQQALYELSQLADLLEAIGDVTGGDVISDHVSALEDIAACIREEMLGRHWWGANTSDYMSAHVALREDLWTPELEESIGATLDSVTFQPAEFEKEEIEKVKNTVGEFGFDDCGYFYD